MALNDEVVQLLTLQRRIHAALQLACPDATRHCWSGLEGALETLADAVVTHLEGSGEKVHYHAFHQIENLP